VKKSKKNTKKSSKEGAGYFCKSRHAVNIAVAVKDDVHHYPDDRNDQHTVPKTIVVEYFVAEGPGFKNRSSKQNKNKPGKRSHQVIDQKI
jgi:hypothetical protein